jgi:hypothetical protein
MLVVEAPALNSFFCPKLKEEKQKLSRRHKSIKPGKEKDDLNLFIA